MFGVLFNPFLLLLGYPLEFRSELFEASLFSGRRRFLLFQLLDLLFNLCGS
jgi:hypothetical protein